MLIYAIDDERNALSIMLRAVEEAEPSAEVRGFSRSAELLSAMEERPCDVVFLDVEMPGLSGVALAKRLKAIHPKVNVIFATGYDQYKGVIIYVRVMDGCLKAGDVIRLMAKAFDEDTGKCLAMSTGSFMHVDYEQAAEKKLGV